MAQKEKVLLLLDYFFGHQVSNVGTRLRVSRLEFLPPNTTNHFQPIDAGIMACFKAQYRKLAIQYQIVCFSANKVFAMIYIKLLLRLSGHGVWELPHRQFKIVGGTRVFIRSLLKGDRRS